MSKGQAGQKKLPGTTEETTLEAEMDAYIAAARKIEDNKKIQAKHAKTIEERMERDGDEEHKYEGWTFSLKAESKFKATKDKAAKKAKGKKGEAPAKPEAASAAAS